jgi:hypothetical protein
MAVREAKTSWAQALRYAFGTAMCLLTVVAILVGVHWYWAVVGLCTGVTMILGRRRIFRPGGTRTANLITCRYIPWYEGNAYFLNVGLPLIAIAAVAAGYAPGNPPWLRFVGILLLVLTPLMTYAAVRMWRRCVLRITPSALTVRLATPGDTGTEIQREAVESIEPKTVPNGVSSESLQVEIAYRTADSSGHAVKTILLGTTLTVKPNNLVDALVAWKDGAHDDPKELLDRIERILRGRPATGG